MNDVYNYKAHTCENYKACSTLHRAGMASYSTNELLPASSSFIFFPSERNSGAATHNNTHGEHEVSNTEMTIKQRE